MTNWLHLVCNVSDANNWSIEEATPKRKKQYGQENYGYGNGNCWHKTSKLSFFKMPFLASLWIDIIINSLTAVYLLGKVYRRSIAMQLSQLFTLMILSFERPSRIFLKNIISKNEKLSIDVQDVDTSHGLVTSFLKCLAFSWWQLTLVMMIDKSAWSNERILYNRL